MANLSSVINYCRVINGSKGFNDTKTQLLSEMAQDYNEGREQAIYRFNVLINTIDAKDVYVNDSDIPIKGVIDVKKKQSADTEMEQVLQVYPNLIKQGDYVKFEMNETDDLHDYIIKSDIEKKHGYDEGIFLKCNYVVKYMIDGQYNEQPCIVSNNTKYTLGIKSLSSGGITEADGMFGLIMRYDDKSKKIRLGQRFIVNDQAWQATQTDHTTVPNILIVLLGETAINYEVDDLQNSIANKWSVKHTYTYKIPASFEVTKSDNYQLVYSIKDETGKDIDYNLVTVSTTDSSLIQITNTNGIITIKGLSVGTGSIKLTATLSSETKEFIISFEVKSTVVNQVNYETDFSQTTTIKQFVTSILQADKYINGIKDGTLKISYAFDSVGQSLISSGKIVVTRKSDSSIAIKNALITTNTTIHLTVTDDSDGSKVLDNQAILLTKGI